jgi:ribosomal protein L22
MFSARISETVMNNKTTASKALARRIALSPQDLKKVAGGVKAKTDKGACDTIRNIYDPKSGMCTY